MGGLQPRAMGPGLRMRRGSDLVRLGPPVGNPAARAGRGDGRAAMTSPRRSATVARSTRPSRKRLAGAGVLALCIISAGAWAIQEPEHGASVPPRPRAASVTVRRSQASAVRAAVTALYELTIPAFTDREGFAAAVEQLAEAGSADHVEAVFGGADSRTVSAFSRRP